MKKPTTNVVAAIITNQFGDILIQERPEGKPLAGLWEIPGGKLEPGELPVDCLQREMQEELGVTFDKSNMRFFMFTTHEFPTDHMLMTVYTLELFSYLPTGQEGQKVRWVRLDQLKDYEMTPSFPPILHQLQNNNG